MARLSISIVYFDTAIEVLARTLASTAESVANAHKQGVLQATSLVLVDNRKHGQQLDDTMAQGVSGLMEWSVRAGHGNLGFGRGHNLAIHDAQSDYHLILNPDVTLDPACIASAVAYLVAEPECVMVTPNAKDGAGNRHYVVRRFPDVFTLFLRGFAPNAVSAMFRERMDRYECRERDWAADQRDVEIASGCFMLARTAALQKIEGFDPAYFLYFEDFDLSLRMRSLGRIDYVAGARITHYGGNAARKGLKHIGMFAESAGRFFNAHGWRFV